MTRYYTLVCINSCFCTALVDIRSNSICPANLLFFHSHFHCKAWQDLVNDLLSYCTITLLIFILELIAMGQTDRHHLDQLDIVIVYFL